MTVTLTHILSGAAAPGIYRLRSRARPSSLASQLARAGWRTAHLDGRAIADKRSFLAAAAAVLGFPAYFGHNWDGFEECLRDLEPGGAGLALLYDDFRQFAQAQPGEWATARALLADAAAQIPLVVLLR